MSWIQQNKLPAVLMGVSAAGAAGLGFLLFSAYSSYSDSLAQFQATNSSLAGLKSASLAPTPENLALKQGLVSAFTHETNELYRVLTTLQAETQPKPTTDTEFQAKLKAAIAESRKTAAAAGMALPAVYNLTFDRYTGELPPSNEVATELSGYLDAVNTIINTFAQSGVRSLDLIERSELPSENGAAAAPKPGQRQPQAPAGPKLTERRQVRATMTLDQGSLQMLMAALANPSQMPYFTVVRQLRIENERFEGPLRSGVVVPGGSNVELDAEGNPIAPPPPIPGAEGEAAAPMAVTAAPPDAVAVLGDERLRVFMEIDLVYFVNLQAAAPAAGNR